MCVCVHLYECVCVCVCVLVCVCVYVDVQVSLYVYVYVYSCVSSGFFLICLQTQHQKKVYDATPRLRPSGCIIAISS